MSDTTIIYVTPPPAQPIKIYSTPKPGTIVIKVSPTIVSNNSSGDGLIEVVNEFHTGLTSNILTLNHEATALTLCLHKGGSRLPTSQYLYTGSEVTLAVVPEITDEFIADYKYPL